MFMYYLICWFLWYKALINPIYPYVKKEVKRQKKPYSNELSNVKKSLILSYENCQKKMLYVKRQKKPYENYQTSKKVLWKLMFKSQKKKFFFCCCAYILVRRPSVVPSVLPRFKENFFSSYKYSSVLVLN